MIIGLSCLIFIKEPSKQFKQEEVEPKSKGSMLMRRATKHMGTEDVEVYVRPVVRKSCFEVYLKYIKGFKLLLQGPSLWIFIAFSFRFWGCGTCNFF